MAIQDRISSAIIAVLQSVPGSGNVFARYKYASNWQVFLDQFVYTDPSTGYRAARGWWLSIPTMREYNEGRSFDEHWHIYTYTIRGIMMLSDKANSEETFGTVLWAIMEELHDHGSFGLTADTSPDGHYVVEGSIDVDVPIAEIRMFGSTLCHYAELQLTLGVAHPVVFQP